METASPYTPPQTELLNDLDEGYGEIKILRAQGRIGRLRYIAYSIGISILIYLAMMAVMMGLGAVGLSGGGFGITAVGLVIIAYGAMLVINVLLTIQRCHDFNTSGWLSLLLLLPLVPLIFWFIPGTKGSNQYGLQPPPNKGAGVAVVVILLVLVVMGILAAIAIPAYQEYMARAAAGM